MCEKQLLSNGFHQMKFELKRYIEVQMRLDSERLFFIKHLDKQIVLKLEWI